jgi:RNA polymerase sigma factor (sigma-70 family)
MNPIPDPRRAAAAPATDRSDEAVMERVRDGQVRELAILFERHHVRLFNYFLRLCGERGAAEDMVQELFLRLLKYRHTWETRARFTTWMFAVARNVHIDQLRRQRPETSLEETPEPAVTSVAGEELEREQSSLLLEQALRQLPLPKREVLLLSRFQEMKYGEIARLTGRSPEAVKVLAHRAIHDLRRIYLGLCGGST